MIDTNLFEQELNTLSRKADRLSYIMSKYDTMAQKASDNIVMKRQLSLNTIKSIRQSFASDPQYSPLVYSITVGLADKGPLNSITLMQEQVLNRIHRLGDQIHDNYELINKHGGSDNATNDSEL